eukprot:Pgem_evm1s3876
MAAAQQVIQYLSKTKHLKLQYYAKPQTTKKKKIRITCFANSSYADLQDRRSAMEFIIVVEGNIVHWGSDVHDMDIFGSSCEAEYVANNNALAQTLNIKHLLQDYYYLIMRY